MKHNRIFINYGKENSIALVLPENELQPFLDSIHKSESYWYKNGKGGFWTNNEKIRYVLVEEFKGVAQDDAESTATENDKEKISSESE